MPPEGAGPKRSEPEAVLAGQLQQSLDQKTKPRGALGRLEALALQLGLVLGSAAPRLSQPQMLVFAADHGLAARGVSAFPPAVTAQMVLNFLAGGAAVSVLARQHSLALTVIDCGVATGFAPHPQLLSRRIAPGTADSSLGPAMTAAQCDTAIANGRALIRDLPGNAVLLGEMGIGNSSAAALLLARLCDLEIDACTGAGTGLDDAGVARKAAILRRVLALHDQARAPLQALAAFGGFEIATMVGSIMEAAARRRVIVVDGFITTAAVLVASRLAADILPCCVFSHRSGERGHALMLSHLRAEPLLDLGLRLGEGSGAALAWPLLVSACAILNEMASFTDAGVAGAS